MARLAWALLRYRDYSAELTRGSGRMKLPMHLAWLLVAGMPSVILAQSVPAARQVSPGRYDILVAAPGAPAQTVLADVQFLPLDLAGFAICDRLSDVLAV